MMKFIKHSTFWKNYIGLLFAIILLSTLLTLTASNFLDTANFVNIGNQIAINLIIAVGMTIVITTGGIDLSVGANVALTGIIAASVLKKLEPGLESAMVSIFVGIAIGMLIGIINGTLITRLSLPPFIATLGMMITVRGVALIYSNGRVVYGLHENFLNLFSGFYGPIPKPIVVAAVVCILGIFILNKTIVGRYAIAIGGNERCVEVCGINVNKYKMIVYAISGSLAAISGLTLTSMMNAAEPIAGNLYELDAIAVVVMGGTSLTGGKGSVIGTLLGALLLGIVRNGLNLMQVQPYYHQLVTGIIILFSVVINSIQSKSSS